MKIYSSIYSSKILTNFYNKPNTINSNHIDLGIWDPQPQLK